MDEMLTIEGPSEWPLPERLLSDFSAAQTATFVQSEERLGFDFTSLLPESMRHATLADRYSLYVPQRQRLALRLRTDPVPEPGTQTLAPLP